MSIGLIDETRSERIWPVDTAVATISKRIRGIFNYVAELVGIALGSV